MSEKEDIGMAWLKKERLWIAWVLSETREHGEKNN